jgi:hypothetical protein
MCNGVSYSVQDCEEVFSVCVALKVVRLVRTEENRKHWSKMLVALAEFAQGRMCLRHQLSHPV